MAFLETTFKQWLSEYQGILYHVVRAYGDTAADQDDLFQEICLQLWMSMPRFEGKSKVSTWIYRVALNSAMVWNRKEKNKRKHREQFFVLTPQEQSGGSQLSKGIIDQLFDAIKKFAEE